MFATRNNNENAIYEQQQAAAAKPLNQGVKGLAPKTPANKPPKTPFGKGKNDENAALEFGKNGDVKEGKAERNAFVTPANPRTRAPLGNKTTNAKALQTPFLLPNKPQDSDRPSSTKPTSPRLRRSKIKVHETAEDVLAQDPEEREIEYMPPREVPKEENYDDIWPRDRDYSMLQGNNLTKGWLSEYMPKKEDNDDDDLSDFEEKYQKAVEREKKEAAAKKRPLSSKSANTSGLKAAPTTIKASHAASALSSRPARPVMSKPTSSLAAPKTRLPANTSSSTTTKKPIFDKGNPRFTAAKAASNSTIGYSKGRVVSAHRRPLSDIHSQPSKPESEDKVTLDQLLNLGSMEIADEDADLGFGSPNKGLDQLMEDDEPEVFQLDPVKEL